MKKNIKKIIIFMLMICIPFIIGNISVNADSNGPNKSETLEILNTTINISEKDYSEYTDDEEEVNWADFYGMDIYDYCIEDYSFCGYYMEYSKKPIIFDLINGEATIHGDDPIIYFIPRELFIHRGTYTYVGKEYGFFVNTRQYSNSGILETANLVDAFIFDIVANYNSNEEKFTYTIKPLYIFTYIYISDYIFSINDKVEIDDINIGLDSSVYTSYSDAIIPIPRMSNERHQNKYGNTYIQNYEKTQPNRDLYAIKDTVAYVSLVSAHSFNKFDSEYDINEDKGYSIRRSYTLYQGASASQVGVTLDELNEALVPAAINEINYLCPIIGKTIKSAEAVIQCVTAYKYYTGEKHIGYELVEQSNNPSDSDKNSRIVQKENEGEYWKFDVKGTRSSESNALIFRPFTCDENSNNPIYEYITYNWSFECDKREQTYLTYGTKVQIAMKNDKTNTYNEISVGYGTEYKIIGNQNPKEVTIFNPTKGYIIKNGIDDIFSFIPQYSGYYKIKGPSNSTIRLYENETLVDSQVGRLEYIFDKNKLYTFKVIMGALEQDSLAYDVSISPHQINTSTENLLDNYMKDGLTEGIVKVYCLQTNMYNIKLFNMSSDSTDLINFKVLGQNLENIKKLYDYGNDDLATNIEGINNINVLLQAGNYYYICFDTIITENVHCNIKKIEEEYTVGVDYSNISDNGDKLSLIKIPYNSNYEIKYNYNNQNVGTSDMYFVILKLRNSKIIEESFELCNENNGEITKNIYLYANDVIYFGYFNCQESLNYYFSIYENPAYSFTVTTENNFATESTGLGTEITLNNGARYDNTIAVGFTRVLYLGGDAQFPSRHNDYSWSSSNEAVATVSVYGTVFAKKVGVTTIRVTDKHNLNHVATLEITVYEKDSPITTIILSTDVNEDPSLNGTEVRLNGGNSGDTTIGVGFTRSICILENGPTNIRQDYNWTSSNICVATVDKYGIVYAESIGTTTITCVNKYDNSYIGTIVITVV